MSSKQINFFMMPEDEKEFESYLKQTKQVSFLAVPMYHQELRVMNSFGSQDPEGKSWSTIYLVLTDDLEKIIINYVPGPSYYLLDELRSPVIQFMRCYYDFSNKKIRRGRLYLNTGYYNQNREWVWKEQEFLDWANNVFKWFRRHFKNQKLKGFEGWLVTQRTAEWVEKEGGELLKL